MKELLEIIKDKRDNAMRDYKVKDKENKSPYELCELIGEINAYNDVITLIEIIMCIEPTLKTFIETFENEKKEK